MTVTNQNLIREEINRKFNLYNEGGTQTERVGERGAEEDVWAEEG
jgi:hypothetical protein